MTDVSAIGDALVAAGHENMQIANCLIMCRPKTVDEASDWIKNNEDKATGHIAGQVVPSSWAAGVDYQIGNPGASFDAGEVVVLNRSDGSVKFGLVQKLNEPSEGVHVVLVECGAETNSVKTVKVEEIGKLTLDNVAPSDGAVSC